MSIASLKAVPEDMRTSIIRIHSYRDKNLQGTFYNLYYGEEIAFGNLTRLLLLMEDMMDEMECPQASVRSRRFGAGRKNAERASIAEELLPKPDQEAIATFAVKVLFRQGASWQGKLAWTEGNTEIAFRSVLEMRGNNSERKEEKQIDLFPLKEKVDGLGRVVNLLVHQLYA